MLLLLPLGVLSPSRIGQVRVRVGAPGNPRPPLSDLAGQASRGTAVLHTSPPTRPGAPFPWLPGSVHALVVMEQFLRALETVRGRQREAPGASEDSFFPFAAGRLGCAWNPIRAAFCSAGWGHGSAACLPRGHFHF